MTREELNTLETSLLANGYKKWETCKTSTHTAHEWMKTIGETIIAFRVWDWEKYRDGEGYAVDVMFVFSNDYRRADLVLTNGELDVKNIEFVASEFNNFGKKYI